MAGTYEPRACGALCDKCPLNGQTPVPPELRAPVGQIFSGDAVAVVGEAPNDQEAKAGRLFVGPSGVELDKGLRGAGFNRNQLHVTTVVLCNPPKNDLKNLLDKIGKHNRKNPDHPIASPIDCCRPRFQKDIENIRRFITLGKTANQAVTGNAASIMAVRGALVTLEATDRTPSRYVMPTVSPGLLLHQMRYAHVFRNDLAKAGRWFRGEAKFEPPTILWHPNADQLREFLWRPGTTYAFDLETDGIDNLTTRIRCIGIGSQKEVALVGLLGKDGFTKFYSPDEEARVIEVLRDYFSDPNLLKIAHNGINFDAVVLYNQLGVRPQRIIDTMLLHKSVESELPHGLGYVVSLFAEAPAWKCDREGNKLSTFAESDVELHRYCVLDVSLTEAIAARLLEQVQLRGQTDVWKLDQKIQNICAEMHMTGMYVDQAERLAMEKKYLRRRQVLLDEIRDRLGRPHFNPNSTDQLRDLLFSEWRLIPPVEEDERLTQSGDPSTADFILRSLLTTELTEAHSEIIRRIRYYRKVVKLLGTYVTKLRPSNVAIEDDLGWGDEDEDWIDQETRKKYGLEKTGIVNPRTGRMYPGYSAGVAVTGRLSSSKPINAQNFVKSLRKMVTAAPGNVLIGADMDQLELRIAAARWGVELYLRAFTEGKDPHSMTAYAVFGDAFCKAAGIDAALFASDGKLAGTDYDSNGKFVGTGESKKMRDLSKAVQYACVASDEKVAVLGRYGGTAISELKEHEDWTWCWSRERRRYEPAQIIAVVPKGSKECVRVTFTWGTGNQYEGSMVVTTDHLCLLRDGTFREAGQLQTNDRLMPFTRTRHETGYRYVYPFNDNTKIGEHRVVKGFYEVGEGEHHVHHRDEDPENNTPSNLEVLHYTDHYEEHREALAEGRRRSEKWLASVQDAETRSAASKLAWENRRAKVASGQKRASKLDSWADRIGREKDSIIASEANCTEEAVVYYRKARGIPAYWREAPGGTNHTVVSVTPVGPREVWDIEVDHEDHNFALEAGVFVHNSQYMAKVETVHKLIQKTEVENKDGTTDLPYAKLPLRQVRDMHTNWLKGAPEFESGWEDEIQTFRRQGYLTEDITFRRRDFLDGEAPNEIVNFGIQSSAAGLMNNALLSLSALIPFEAWGPGTGIINQCHDALVIECPADGASYTKDENGKIKWDVPKGSIPWKVMHWLEECLNCEHPALPGVKFTATADIGLTWKDV